MDLNLIPTHLHYRNPFCYRSGFQLKIHSAKILPAFILGILLMVIELLVTAFAASRLHPVLQSLGYMAENYIIGVLVAIVTCMAALAIYLLSKDKSLIPYSFALIFVFFILIVFLCMLGGADAVVMTFLMPTMGVLSVIGNMLFWLLFRLEGNRSR